FENRHHISFHISSDHNYSPSEMFQKFIQEINSQVPYNNGKVNAIPIILIMILLTISKITMPSVAYHL
ncbi:MAG: hypothetical protein WBF33_14945, partial [Candidatus Nitrosopolaris sp.]